MKSNIAIIGFMGSGKSIVGARLSRRLGRQFIELDRLIALRAGKSIADIFRDEGESGFRNREEGLINEISASAQNAVISCGGGAVVRPGNISALKESSVIVYLETTANVLQERLARSRNRPLLNVDDRALAVEKLLDTRRPLYEAAADLTIRTSKRPFAAVINEIIEKLGIDERNHR
jgi:shikimate kinase